MQRISSIPIGTKIATPTWGVVVGLNMRYASLQSGTDLESLISVTAALQVPSTGPIWCSSAPVPEMEEDNTWRTWHHISYQCATSWTEGPLAYTPQIYVQTDYARLNITRSNFTPEGSIMIWPSFTSNIQNVLASTKPTSLLIGTSFVARVDGTIRASFTAPMRATFGFSSSQDMHIIGRLAILGADPLVAGMSPLRSEGFASIRLVKTSVRTADWELYSDKRQHTVLDGPAALGGFSVFLNSVFLVLFGGSLALVLFDVKPLSVFGLLHSFSKTGLSQRFKEDFPELRDEGGQPGDSSAGLVTLIREHMLDFGPLPKEAKEGDGGLGGQAPEASPS